MGFVWEAARTNSKKKKVFLEILQNSQENTCVFPVIFAKFLRTVFYRTPLVAASVDGFHVK